MQKVNQNIDDLSLLQDAGYDADEAWRDLSDLRTVLLKQNRPVDVEKQLRAFKAKHTLAVDNP